MSTGQKFPDHFSGVANRYADFRPHYPPELFDYLATLAPATATVWDCACGNGQASFDLATRFHKVIATDASKEQIASASRHPNIQYLVARAEDSELPARSVGLLTVAQAVHWFDFEKFYPEVNRILAPGGVIAVWCYGNNTVEDPAINRLIYEFYGQTVGSYWPPQRVLVEEAYRTIPFPFIELTAPKFRMEISWNLDQLLGYYSTWSATNRYIDATGKNPLEPLAAALKPLWGDPVQPRTITWPLAMRVGRKK